MHIILWCQLVIQFLNPTSAEVRTQPPVPTLLAVTHSKNLRYLPMPPDPFNYTVQSSPLRILVSNFESIMSLEDTSNIFRHVAFDIYAHMQLDPTWVMRPMSAAYGRRVGTSIFGILPTTAMRNQDLGIVAAQLLIWQEFFGCYVEFNIVVYRRLPHDESIPIGSGFLQMRHLSH